jgi:hypothetical protein
VLLVVGYEREYFVQQYYDSVVWVAFSSCCYCMPEESDVPIFVATNPTGEGFSGLWTASRHFD